MKEVRKSGIVQTIPFILIVVLSLLSWAYPVAGVVIYDADFDGEPVGPLSTQPNTDPLPLNLPTNTIRDAGCHVDVVASAGNLSNKPVLLNSVPGGLASAAFYNPSELTSGQWQISWDSLVLRTPVDGRQEQGNMHIVAEWQGHLPGVWGLKYNPDGHFLIRDADGFHSIGSFTLGISDHFDLHLDLDNKTYILDINGSSILSGQLIEPGEFRHVYFRSNGRGWSEDIAPLAFDNFLVIPESATFLPSYAKYSGGTGEPNDPYLIYTAEQMNAIGAEPNDWDKHFELMADLDLSGTTYSTAVIPQFTGVFDGNGHKISNFNYTSTDKDRVGLFGYVNGVIKNGVIKDLGLIDPNIDAGTGDYVGSLVGQIYRGTITNCYVEGGNITGNDHVGGLVGVHSRGTLGYAKLGPAPYTISNCCSTCNVQGTRSVGGLVGSNEGTITNCYSTGSVAGNADVGGLVGRNGYALYDPFWWTWTFIEGTISNCYSTGSVSGNENIGGLVGDNLKGEITNSFWDKETSGQTNSAGGEGKTTAEMQMASTFLDAGWDFVGESVNGIEDIWWILEGQDYPRLWWQLFWAFSPYPQDGATNVIQPLSLRWVPGEPTLQHDIYFGEDEQVVANATTESLGIYCGRLPIEVTTFDSGKLEIDKTYYWRIDEYYNDATISKGPVWSFTTANFLIVDDFESYNDLDSYEPGSKRIFNTWIDGYDDPTNGSLVGYEVPPWVKQTIVHTGTESMSLYYDNSVGISEATANIANLEIGQNWTESGVETLSLWFYGDPSNAPEPMYVALADANGSTAVVYHDSPNTTQITTWREWRIDLQAFADQGVDLTNIDTISIGFGNRNNPVAGGSGTMYFDDIRLYRPAEPETETGETTILGTWSWNVETDTLVRSSNTDFCWVHVTSTERYLLPINGAQAAVVTGRSFDEIDSAFVNSLTLSSQKLSGSDVGSVLTPGAVIAFRTSEGNKGKLRIEGYRALHDFSFPEASYMDEGWKSYALTKPNIEKYHLHVKWCLF